MSKYLKWQSIKCKLYDNEPSEFQKNWIHSERLDKTEFHKKIDSKIP